MADDADELLGELGPLLRILMPPRLRQAEGLLGLALLVQQGLRALLLDKELTLILVPIDDVKDRHVMEDRLALAAHHGIDQRRQRQPVTPEQIELHLGDRPLQLQQRQKSGSGRRSCRPR